MPPLAAFLVGTPAVGATYATAFVPATAGIIGTGGAVYGGVIAAGQLAGAGVSAYGIYQQGQAAEAQGKTEQKLLNYNAELKQKESDAERDRARVEAIHFRKEGEALMAGQRVDLAKGGVLTTVGTPALLLEETARNLDADRLQILKNGYLAGSFRESEAEGLRYQGRAARASGSNLQRGARLSAAGTLLTGAGSAYSKYKMT
jgi:hypothetical protein